MNVTVEDLAPCRKLLRIEVDGPAVDAALASVTSEFQRQAKLPGFRPGKAPRDHILKVYARDIEAEAKHKLTSDAYRQALKEQKLRVIRPPDIEEIQFSRGQSYQFAATIETAPEFELPEYKGLLVSLPQQVVTQADQDRAMSVLRERKATYLDVQRPVQEGDFVVINFHGTCEGKAIAEITPTARGLSEQKNYWLKIDAGSFLPGFGPQLAGANAGEHRVVNVQFPADFVQSALAGKPAVYEVDIVQVKELVLPELNDDFAKAYGAETVDKLREGVRQDLQKELNYKQRNEIRRQIIQRLLETVSCDLPESVVDAETRSIVYDLVRENQQRGVTKEVIEQKKDEIYSFASNNARDRVKLAFILGRIAEKENIQASENEIGQRIITLAQQHQIRPEKLAKQLRDGNGLLEIENQIVDSKVLDFLQLHARMEEIPTGQT